MNGFSGLVWHSLIYPYLTSIYVSTTDSDDGKSPTLLSPKYNKIPEESNIPKKDEKKSVNKIEWEENTEEDPDSEW